MVRRDTGRRVTLPDLIHGYPCVAIASVRHDTIIACEGQHHTGRKAMTVYCSDGGDLKYPKHCKHILCDPSMVKTHWEMSGAERGKDCMFLFVHSISVNGGPRSK